MSSVMPHSARPVMSKSLALFAYGFRPFFLLAGLQAALALPIWLLVHAGAMTLPTAFPPAIWHSHEMLYGFGVAVLTGFFLTAVPNWTGAPPLRGGRLAALASLWLAGRIVFWLSALIPAGIVATVDLAFLPALALTLASHLLPGSAKRQRVFLVLLALLFIGNLLVHLDALGLSPIDGRRGVYLALDIFVLLITIMGGRIVPSFTANVIRCAGGGAEPLSYALVEKLTIGLTALVIPLELFLGSVWIVGIVALAAASFQAVRLAAWRSHASLREPILWVLHLGYLWLPLGLALRGMAMTADLVPANAGLHALTVGAIGTMTLAVMSRAALGHTGRPLKAAPLTVAAYVLVTMAALIRMLGAIFASAEGYRMTLDASGTAWTLAFILFVAAYAPILLRPRPNGQAG